MSDSGSDEVYCICRTSEANRFMIGCDHCEEWYHGDCIKVTEKEAKYIKKYYCKVCIEKNPDLRIVFKSKHRHHRSREDEGEKHRDRHDRRRDRSKDRDGRPRHKHKKDKRDHRHHGHRHRRRDDEDRSKAKKSGGGRQDRAAVKEDGPKSKPKTSRSLSTDSSSSSLSEQQLEDRSGQKRDVVEAARPPRKDKKDNRVLREINRPHEANRRKPSAATAPDEDSEHDPEDESSSGESAKSDDDGDDIWRPGPVTTTTTMTTPSTKGPPRGSSGGSSAAPPPSLGHTATSQAKPVTLPHKRKAAAQKPQKVQCGVAAKKRKERNGSSSDGGEAEAMDPKLPRQCQGHKCVYACRPGSNYCSDTCGINLASLRIMQTLPDRIREWNLSECQAEKRNRKELEQIRAKQNAVKKRLEHLNEEFRSLEELILRGKQQTMDEDDEDDEDEGCEMTVHCVTCGADVQTRTAIRHMERCYNKMESQTSFASKFKTQIEDARMFCDYYNPKDQTYCKRLQVLCPEHNPDTRVAENEVCGYPIQKELFGKPVEFCRLSKKVCQRHVYWEKLRRAEIDMERVRQWMKVDELLEQERMVKSAMSSRAGVLGLLLHSTYNHELQAQLEQQQQQLQMRRMQMQRQQQQQQQQKFFSNSKPS